VVFLYLPLEVAEKKPKSLLLKSLPLRSPPLNHLQIKLLLKKLMVLQRKLVLLLPMLLLMLLMILQLPSELLYREPRLKSKYVFRKI
jgi:hypothetical protein